MISTIISRVVIMSYTAGCRTWKKYEPQKLSLKHVKTMIDRYETTYETEEIDDYENIEEIKYKNRLLSLLSCVLVSIIRCLIPRFTFGSFSILIVVLGAVFPTKFFIYLLIYPFCRLVFGTLYPAYASYKAVRTKNLKEYVKWMMYWIVFALFTCVETFTDVFFSWFPFYYEVKIILVLWLLSPATRGSSILYRKFVHPALCRREQEIDEYISKAKEQGYHTVLNLGTKGVNYATAVIMQTAIKGGGGLVQQLRRSYSLSDLSDGSHCDVIDEGRDVYAGDVIMSNTAAVVRRVNVGRRGFSPRRSASESNSRSAIYFSELDCNLSNSHGVDVNDFGHIKSSEDISSGYSSADNNSVILSTTNSIGVRTRSNTSRQHAGGNNRNTFTNVRRPQPAEGITYVEQDMFESYPNQITPIYRISQTNPPFLLECIGDRVKIVQVLGESNYVVGCDDEFVDTEDEAGEILRNLTSDVRVGDSICDAGKKNNDVDKIVEVRLNQCVDKSEAIDKIVEFDACSEITVDISTVELVVPSAPTLSEIEETKAIHLNRELVSEKNCGVIDSSKMNDTENIYPSEVLEMLKNEDESVAQLGCLPASIISSNDKISLYDSLVNVDSDDEASFGTPEDSPKFKHKVKGGRYGKSKAPSPPKVEDTTVKENTDTLKPSNKKHKRAKSRSPSKRKDSTISKIKHLSGKFAFWNRGDKNVEESDTESESRKSSIDLTDAYYESSSEFKISLTDLNKADSSHFEIDGSSISKEIYDKSDALQRLIEAKLENYAEYRISLHDGTGTSKSTDV